MSGTKEKCPVCGKEFEGIWAQPFPADYEGMKYFCCSKECLNKFEAEPEKYA